MKMFNNILLQFKKSKTLILILIIVVIIATILITRYRSNSIIPRQLGGGKLVGNVEELLTMTCSMTNEQIFPGSALNGKLSGKINMSETNYLPAGKYVIKAELEFFDRDGNRRHTRMINLNSNNSAGPEFVVTVPTSIIPKGLARHRI